MIKYKGLLAGILVFVVLFILVMANQKEETLIYMEPQDSYLEVEVKPNSLTKTGVVLTLKNNREDCIYSYAADWWLQHFVDGTWQDVPYIIEDVGVSSIGYILLPETQNEFEVEWEWMYGKLPKGKYKFSKWFECIEYFPITSREELEAGKEEMGETLHVVDVYIEFEVK